VASSGKTNDKGGKAVSTNFEIDSFKPPYKLIQYETDERVAIISLNRPEKLNAMNHKVRVELLHALKHAESDDSIRTVVIRGAGRSFGTGYDLTPTDPTATNPNYREGGFISPSQDSRHQAYLRSLADFYRHLWDLIKPTIASIHGWCIGGATELVSFCDLRIAADNATFGYPIARNISSGDVLYQPWFMGSTFARRWLLTGDEIPAQEMYRIGWLTEICPEDKLWERTMYWAKRIALIDTARVSITKRSINRAYEVMGFWTAVHSAQEIFSHARPDNTEYQKIVQQKGLKAALESRDAPFGDYRAKGR
jgi:enoyl-CoA hydratase